MKNPTITVNGTAASVLRSEYMEAVHRLQDARCAVEAITIHPRDYALSNFDLALSRRRQLNDQLTAMIRELLNVAEHCDQCTKDL